MKIIKQILAWLAIVLAAIGILICLAGIILAWVYNPTVKQTLIGGLSAVEKVMAAGDEGLGRVETRLSEAQAAVDTVTETVEGAGDQLSSTNVAFEILERTVGDELFPKIEAARDTIQAIAGSLVALNATLEAANEIPFVEVPTISSNLEAASAQLESSRESVTATRAELQEMKSEAIEKPVTAITSRTGAISDGLDQGQEAIAQTRQSLDEAQSSVNETAGRVPRLINLISLAITLILFWLGLAQASLLTQAVGVLRGHDPLASIKNG